MRASFPFGLNASGRTAAVLFFTVALFSARQSSALTGGPDAWGYTFIDSNEASGPAFQWIDISSSGQQVVFYGDDVSSNSPSPNGIGSAVDLEVPVVLYGETFTRAVPTSNGALSLDFNDTGADNDNDCPLPVNLSGIRDARIYPLHDDLGWVNGPNRGVYYEYLPVSPHPHHNCGVSVFQWKNIGDAGATYFIDFQVLLFDNGDIIMQYGAGNATVGATSTTGIQNADGDIGLTYACDTASRSRPGSPSSSSRPPFSSRHAMMNSTLRHPMATAFPCARPCATPSPATRSLLTRAR